MVASRRHVSKVTHRAGIEVVVGVDILCRSKVKDLFITLASRVSVRSRKNTGRSLSLHHGFVGRRLEQLLLSEG